MRKFVTTGLCVPSKHYMADTSDKISKIRKLIDEGNYFTINRGRQYGKTTTLFLLKNAIKKDYIVASICFQGLDDEAFATPKAFCQTLLQLIDESLQVTYDSNATQWLGESVDNFQKLGLHIKKICREQKVVLFIDEVDKTSTNRTFLDFLGMLRGKFLATQAGEDFTFHSVVLAGVHDIKNIKQKLVREGKHTLQIGEGSYNSPWNIAVQFNVDMSLNSKEIASMLQSYENDHKTGIDITSVSEAIYVQTSGYPFLVSRLCQIIEDDLDRNWTENGVLKAVEIILKEQNTLFDDMSKNLENNPDFYKLVYEVLMLGEKITYQIDNPLIQLGACYGYFERNNDNIRDELKIANKIFEKRITNYFVSKNQTSDKKISGILFNDIVKNGRFNMQLCLEKFAKHFREIYAPKQDGEFLERHYRLLFISYLKPLINGKGFYHFESQFTDFKRMDIVVDYGEEQFIIELKRWKGESEHERMFEQLLDYMDSKGVKTAYGLTFDFRKNQRSEFAAPEWQEYGDKRILDVIA